MLAFLELLAATYWGLSLTTRLGDDWEPSERLAAGVVLGTLPVLWLPLPLGWALGISTGSKVALVLILALAAIEATTQKKGRSAFVALLREGAKSLSEHASARALALLTAGFAALCVAFVTTHYFLPRDGGLLSAGTAWGDLTLHASISSGFLFGDNFHPPQYPYFAGWPLSYPFLPDLAAAHVASLGWGLAGAMRWLNAVVMTALFVLFFHLARRWAGGSTKSAFFAAGLFFLSGGLGFAYLLRGLLHGASGAEAWSYNATYEPGSGIAYGNVLGNVFVASWGASFGMALGLVALLLLTRARPQLTAAGVLVGALPLVHSHSFLTIGGVGLSYALFSGRARWRSWVWFFAPALLALPQLWWISRHTGSSAPFATVTLGWPQRVSGVGEWLASWVRNWGVFFVLAPVAFWRAPSALRRLTAWAPVAFVLSNLVVLSPATYHNVKFLVWAHLALSIVLGDGLGRLWDAGRVWARPAAALALLTCVASGAQAVVFELRERAPFMSAQDVEFAAMVRAQTPTDAVFLTAGDMHDPVTVLAGRRVVCGAHLWLSNHGIPFEERERDVRRIFEGDSDADALLRRYGVNYVVVGPRERAAFPQLDEERFRGRAVEIVRVRDTALYKL